MNQVIITFYKIFDNVNYLCFPHAKPQKSFYSDEKVTLKVCPTKWLNVLLSHFVIKMCKCTDELFVLVENIWILETETLLTQCRDEHASWSRFQSVCVVDVYINAFKNVTWKLKQPFHAVYFASTMFKQITAFINSSQYRKSMQTYQTYKKPQQNWPKQIETNRNGKLNQIKRLKCCDKNGNCSLI